MASVQPVELFDPGSTTMRYQDYNINAIAGGKAIQKLVTSLQISSRGRCSLGKNGASLGVTQNLGNKAHSVEEHNSEDDTR